MRTFPLLLLIACLDNPTGLPLPSSPTGPGKHLLFVGNSLTFSNSLPQILEALADSAGEPLLETGALAFPDYSLQDHWNSGRVQATLEQGGWHHVVLQQGPSSVEANRQLLIRYVALIDSVARGTGAGSALYMVWPTSDRQQDFARASESYRMAADSVDGLLFPVGDAWLETWKLDPDAQLYATDGLHPSAAGSYLAALVMYSVLYAKSPVGLPATLRLRDGRTFSIPLDLATTLQQAAAASIPAAASR